MPPPSSVASVEPFSFSASASASASSSSSSSSSLSADEKAEAQSLIWESKASTVKHGEKVAVVAEACHVPFDPVNCSPRCILGVSVSLGLMLAGAGPIDVERLGLHIAATCNGFLYALEVQPYVADECVICLDSRPDTVLYPCRHQCCHYNCVKDLQKKCPICRATVRACIRPPNPVVPHPHPERRAKQTIPITVLEQERTLWKKMLSTIKKQTDGKTSATNSAAIQTAAAQELALAQQSLRAARVSIELMKMELEKQLAISAQREQALANLTDRLQLSAAAAWPANRKINGASAGILCPKLHRMTWMNTRPTASYNSAGFGCDVCNAGPVPYDQGFSHCHTCTNYDLCQKCSNIAIQLVSFS